jgi:hypothetical protein
MTWRETYGIDYIFGLSGNVVLETRQRLALAEWSSWQWQRKVPLQSIGSSDSRLQAWPTLPSCLANSSSPTLARIAATASPGVDKAARARLRRRRRFEPRALLAFRAENRGIIAARLSPPLDPSLRAKSVIFAITWVSASLNRTGARNT